MKKPNVVIAAIEFVEALEIEIKACIPTENDEDLDGSLEYIADLIDLRRDVLDTFGIEVKKAE